MVDPKMNEEEAQALDNVRKCIFTFTQMAAVRCAIELGIPEIVEDHPGGMTLLKLSSELGCSAPSLHRVMRFLTHHGIFKQVINMDGQDSPVAYAQTAFSRLLMKNKMAHILLLASNPEIVAAKLSLSKFLVSENEEMGAFEVAHGMDMWQYIVVHPSFGELFNKGMGCLAKSTISTLIENGIDAFQGISSLVDVGGGNGSTLHAIVKACPWITLAVNFDLPHAVSPSDSADHRVQHVGGDMFVDVPTADAAFLMSVLHDWDDKACVKILKNCIEAIPRETGKVIIVEVVIYDDEDEVHNKYRDYQLGMDMEMMADTIKGKERTSKEWANLLKTAGFTKHTIKQLQSPQSVIQAYP